MNSDTTSWDSPRRGGVCGWSRFELLGRRKERSRLPLMDPWSFAASYSFGTTLAKPPVSPLYQAQRRGPPVRFCIHSSNVILPLWKPLTPSTLHVHVPDSRLLVFPLHLHTALDPLPLSRGMRTLSLSATVSTAIVSDTELSEALTCRRMQSAHRVMLRLAFSTPAGFFSFPALPGSAFHISSLGPT